MSKTPIAKGRIAAIVDKYPAKDPATGQDILKNRYATIGKLTIWPGDNGGQDFSVEIDTIPVGATGPIKAVVFMETDTQQQPQQQGYDQQPPQQYMQPTGQPPQQQYQAPPQQAPMQRPAPSGYSGRRG